MKKTTDKTRVSKKEASKKSRKLARKQENAEKNRPSLTLLEEAELLKSAKLNNLKKAIFQREDSEKGSFNQDSLKKENRKKDSLKKDSFKKDNSKKDSLKKDGSQKADPKKAEARAAVKEAQAKAAIRKAEVREALREAERKAAEKAAREAALKAAEKSAKEAALKVTAKETAVKATAKSAAEKATGGAAGKNAAREAERKMLTVKAPVKAPARETVKKTEAGARTEKPLRSEILKRFQAMQPAEKGKIKIIMLGGLEQIGMNITAFESDNSIVIVDCGMAFPDDSMLGIDLVIPDITYLKERADKIEGFFITHGHEDHIGALPYVLRELNVPVYSTRLTRALIENKLAEAGLLESAKLHTVYFGDFIEAGDFMVEFIKTNHSIQDAAALAIHSPAGVILHTGDFKVDYTPVFGDTIDLQRFAELGKNGVLALLCDSTNAVRQGFTMSERVVGRTFEAIFGEHTDKRIIVATFASNVDRVQQVITVAEKYGRKVVIDGRSMINVVSTAASLGYIQMKEGTLIDISQIRNYPEEKTVLVVTGSQGESMAALSRMATGQHRKVFLSDKDVIVMSSTPIPGNEKAVSHVINELSRRHTKVIYQDTHVSGHACVEELKLIYALVHPRFSIPVHGEFRHRLAQREVALAIGMPKENVLMADTGDVIEISEDACTIVDKVQAGPILVDGLGVGDVGNIVLRDRQSLSQNGIIIVVMSLDRYTGQLMAGPDIVTRGFIYVRENEVLIEEMRKVVLQTLEKCEKGKGGAGLDNTGGEWAHLKNVIRDEMNNFIWHKTKRTPMILPIITEV